MTEPEGSPQSTTASTTPSDQVPDGVSVRTDNARRHCYQVVTLLAVCALVYILGVVLDVLSLPVGMLIWTAIFVFILYGPVNAMARRGMNRVLACAIAYIAMFAVLIVLGFIFFSPMGGMVSQFEDMLSGLPATIDALNDWWEGFYADHADLLGNATVSAWLDSATNSLYAWASHLADSTATGIINFGVGLGSALTAIGFALVVAFWLLMELPKIGAELRRIVPDEHREEASMFHLTITRVVGGYIKATLIQCLIIGVVCGIGYQILGVPNAAALGLITGTLNIIPVVGPWFGGGVAGIVGFLISPLIGLIALVLTIVVQQFVYTFISPKLMSDSCDVHPAAVIIAMLFGGAIGTAMQGVTGAILGMLLSIPVVAIAKAVAVYYYERKTGRQIVSEDGVFFNGTPFYQADGVTPDPLADAIGQHGHDDDENWHARVGKARQAIRDSQEQYGSMIMNPKVAGRMESLDAASGDAAGTQETEDASASEEETASETGGPTQSDRADEPQGAQPADAASPAVETSDAEASTGEETSEDVADTRTVQDASASDAETSR
jgi:predicted PurR-regulated permease PerM